MRLKCWKNREYGIKLQEPKIGKRILLSDKLRLSLTYTLTGPSKMELTEPMLGCVRTRI
jgi:hypothetical protein